MKAAAQATQKWLSWLEVAVLVAVTATNALAQQTPQAASKESQILLDAGQTAYEQGRYDDAVRAYTKVIVLEANSSRIAAMAYLRTGNVYLAEKQYERAIAAYQRAVTLNPEYAE